MEEKGTCKLHLSVIAVKMSC